MYTSCKAAKMFFHIFKGRKVPKQTPFSLLVSLFCAQKCAIIAYDSNKYNSNMYNYTHNIHECDSFAS